MSVVRVAFPITRIKTRLTLSKGRPWSVIEHVILEALSHAPLSMSELEEGFQLSRSVAEEALVRLMRAEWVHMIPNSTGLMRFTAGPVGAAAAAHQILPHAFRRIQRVRTQLFDRIAGHVFRPGDLVHIRRDELDNGAGTAPIIILSARLPEGMYRADELLEVSLDEDEQLLGVEATGEYWPDRLALVRVTESRVTGLPIDRSLEGLRMAILREVAKFRSVSSPSKRAPPSEAFSPPLPIRHRIRFEPKDLVLGGPAHRDAIETILREAVSRIIIHSTFLDCRRVQNLLPLMIAAVRRGVTIDILWGQETRDDDNRRRKTAAEGARALQEEPQVAAYRERIRIHTDSTRSHAKIILADLGHEYHFVALVGSCNWLSSPFRSVEASVYLREPAIVREVAQCLLRLTHASSGMWSPLATDLLQVARSLANQPATRTPNGRAALVVGEHHNTYMLRARDEARRTILLTSNRLGQFFRPGALKPLAQACSAGHIHARVLYSLLQGITNAQASQFIQDAAAENIRLRPIRDPRVHAKILAWDEDTAVITSQNWLSADPGPTSLATELGVAIDSPWVGKLVRERFNACLKNPRSPRHSRRRPRPRGRRTVKQ